MGEQTRQKLKQAYDLHFAATIERAEKQIILARHGRRLLSLLDDTPVVPGDIRPAFDHANQARQILHDAEEDLRDWQPDLEPLSSAGLDSNLMASNTGGGHTTTASTSTSAAGGQQQHPSSYQAPLTQDNSPLQHTNLPTNTTNNTSSLVGEGHPHTGGALMAENQEVPVPY